MQANWKMEFDTLAKDFAKNKKACMGIFQVQQDSWWNFKSKKVICKVCHTELFYSGNTMNMWTHVEHKHPIKHKLLSSQTTKDKMESSSNQKLLLSD